MWALQARAANFTANLLHAGSCALAICTLLHLLEEECMSHGVVWEHLRNANLSMLRECRGV